MNPAQALSRILAVQPALDAIERDQVGPRATFDHLKIGQTLTGLVKNQTNGVSLLEIEGQLVAMRLPTPVAIGDTLRLRFAGHTPQPVFLLETPETAASDAPQLSKMARMLSDIMQRVPERALPTLTPTGPLLSQPTAVPTELVLALRTALVRSGLFYESHLANWVAGQDSLDGLMQEPQNRQNAESARSAAALTVLDGTGSSDPKLPNPMHTLLTQQLQVLESPHLAWRGELWPGQSLEWQVRQETNHPENKSANPPAPGEGSSWESHLKLTLPQLGSVAVHIKLDAHQTFSIRMVPEQPETGPILQANQTRLIEQLVTAGCTLQSITVEQDVRA